MNTLPEILNIVKMVLVKLLFSVFVACIFSVMATGSTWVPVTAKQINGEEALVRRTWSIHAIPRVTNAPYQLLHSFAGPDGEHPVADVFPGGLFGTTEIGGAYNKGTIFTLDTHGLSLLHSFSGGQDGASPDSSVLSGSRGVYGTTLTGGAYGLGTVYVFGGGSGPLSGERVIHSFSGGMGGSNPASGFLESAEEFYGTTVSGGQYNAGTIFEISPAYLNGDTQNVLYSFKGGMDGSHPFAGLINYQGPAKTYTFLGTTRNGGKYDKGTIFQVTSRGKETVLHVFGAPGDGANPIAQLVYLNGNVYGTTTRGGKYDRGTVFKFGNFGGEEVLHSFSGGNDGAFPQAELVAVGADLYGTTLQGGSVGCGGAGCGVVFSISGSGIESIVHRFSGAPKDGQSPETGLVFYQGSLTGTTVVGGTYNRGTIFSVQPSCDAPPLDPSTTTVSLDGLEQVLSLPCFGDMATTLVVNPGIANGTEVSIAVSADKTLGASTDPTIGKPIAFISLKSSMTDFIAHAAQTAGVTVTSATKIVPGQDYAVQVYVPSSRSYSETITGIIPGIDSLKFNLSATSEALSSTPVVIIVYRSS